MRVEPTKLRGKELLAYTPSLKRKPNENITDYKLRQLDYWLKHTEHKKKPWYRRWFSKTKTELRWI